MKVCVVCGNNRDVAKFFKSTRSRVCLPCQANKRVASTKDQRLQEQYHITHDEWLAILFFQGGRCALCRGRRVAKRGRPDFDTDHDHALEKLGLPIEETLRGLLCKRCNRRLLPGCVDSIDILNAAIDYLRHGRERTQRVLSLFRAGLRQVEPGVWKRPDGSDSTDDQG